MTIHDQLQSLLYQQVVARIGYTMSVAGQLRPRRTMDKELSLLYIVATDNSDTRASFFEDEVLSVDGNRITLKGDVSHEDDNDNY